MGQYVVVVLDGYGVQVIGPFQEENKALSYGDNFYSNKDYWVEKIVSPEPEKEER